MRMGLVGKVWLSGHCWICSGGSNWVGGACWLWRVGHQDCVVHHIKDTPYHTAAAAASCWVNSGGAWSQEARTNCAAPHNVRHNAGTMSIPAAAEQGDTQHGWHGCAPRQSSPASKRQADHGGLETSAGSTEGAPHCQEVRVEDRAAA
jgi:hypothetical protein